MPESIYSTAAGISTPLGLGAFGLVLVTSIILAVLRSNRRKPIPNGLVAVMIVTIVVPTSAWVIKDRDPSTYHVRLTVLDPANRPVDDARVVPSVGNEPLKVPGGYQIEISSDKRPADGKVTFIATEPGSFGRGETSLVLGSDKNPQAVIHLTVETDKVMISGIVEDRSGRAVAGATVSIPGYGDEKVVTDATGSFSLKTHAAVDQPVLVHAEKAGVGVANEHEPAGRDPVTLVLRAR